MPAESPQLLASGQATLDRLGRTLKARRKALGISATAAAQAAQMSRVTWHRVEAGEPSVTMGAYLNAATVLGWVLGATEPSEASSGLSAGPASEPASRPPSASRSAALQAASAAPAPPTAPAAIRLADHPQLARLAWQMPASATLTPQEALGLYERNWRHIDQAALAEPERALLAQLIAHEGRGRLLV